MSKIDELRVKYTKVSKATFEKFVKEDGTTTKKYLEYFLKMWTRKLDGKVSITASTLLIRLVKEFDELLPYIQDKDIYSSTYFSYTTLKEIVESARQIKEDKTFKREDNVIVLEETEDYLFLIPKTHLGSLKYGASTKWCTASKNNPQTFLSYINSGCLAYLIDKTGKKSGTSSKIAFYINKSFNPLFGGIDVYNSADSIVNDKQLIDGGWSHSDLIKFNIIFRSYSYEWTKVKNATDDVEKTLKILKSIDVSFLKKNMEVIESYKDNDYISNIKEAIESFTKKIKVFKDGVTTT